MAQRIPMRLLDGDIDGIRSRDGMRRAIVDILRELGLIHNPSFPTKRRPKLRAIQDDEEND